MVIAEVNDGLCEDNDACMFVTTLYAAFDAATGRVDYVNAGHPHPLLVKADGSAHYLPGTQGMALGVMDGLSYNKASVVLERGDLLLMFSDGVTEAMNEQAQEYGCDRLLALFNQPGSAPGNKPLRPQDAVQKMVASVDEYASGTEQSDDITVIALLFNGVQGGAA